VFYTKTLVAEIDADTYDFSVKNPNVPEESPLRSPQEILADMETLDKESGFILRSTSTSSVIRGLGRKKLRRYLFKSNQIKSNQR